MKYLLYVIASALFQAFAYGYIAKTYADGSNFQFYFIVFSLCSLFYLVRSNKQDFKEFRPRVVLIFQLNALTAIAFISFFLSLLYIPASVSSLVEASIGPVAALVASVWWLGANVKRSDVLSSCLLLVILLCASVLIFNHAGWRWEYFAGAGLSLLAGSAAALIAVMSRKLGIEGLRSESVLAFRFLLAAAVCLSYVLFFGEWRWHAQFLLTAMGVAFFGVVLPLLLLQQAMQKIQPIFSMTALSAIPGFTYLSEVFLGSEFDYSVFWLILSGVISSVIYVLFSSRRLTA